MEPDLHITTRWRTHEFVLVTLLILLALAGRVWPIFEYSPAQLGDGWGYDFAQTHLPFDYYKNVLFPHCGFLVLLYVCYCWMNAYIIPGLMPAVMPAAAGSYRMGFSLPVQLTMNGKQIIAGLLHAFLLTLLLGVGLGIAYTYTDVPAIDSSFTGMLIVGKGLGRVIGWVIGYLAYAFIREMVIFRLQEDSAGNADWIALINQVSGFLLVYFTVGSVLWNFGFMDDHGFSVLYFLVLPPVMLAGLTNLYWIFPLKGDGKFWQWRILRRLLLSTLGWGIPFLWFGIPESHDRVPAIFSMWVGQLAITTPISWFIYRQRKDKILQVQGLRTALGRSEADLQFLRSQINPHFLFNVLNTLYGTALQEKAGRTAGGIQRLGDMMRFMLHENHLQSIPMSKEIDYLKNYIALQQLRTENSESIHIETIIDEECPGLFIAPMLLIPFVENGFKHGISLREPSWIKLRLHCEGKRILFEIRNSVHVRQGDDPEKTRSGIGLKNVLHRLKLLYPERHEFYMHQDEKEFFVQLSIQP